MAKNNINIIIQADDKASKKIRGVGDEIDGTSKAGRRFKAAMGAVAKTTAVVSGLAAAAASKYVLWNGAIRALNIEDAKAKLRGLGHDVKTVNTIMDSALASVKGTAYGLDDAATAAASAVAAGVKPGKELTKYLKTAADTATIAGTEFGEMGAIFGKVQTQQKAYTLELNQLANRGIPIYQWLQEELGVTQGALRDMVKDGEIDSATYFRVIQKNIGGAALESGKTTRGAWANLKAALARAGAEIATDAIPKVRAAFGTLTEWVDNSSPKLLQAYRDIGVNVGRVTPKIVELGKEVGSYLGPKLKRLWEVVSRDLGPSLLHLWREVIKPMLPVVGTLFVAALGLAIDALTLGVRVTSSLIDAIVWLTEEMKNGNPIIWVLVGSFGALAAAMVMKKAFGAAMMGFELLRLKMLALQVRSIPATMAKMQSLRKLISKRMVVGAIGVGLALAAIQKIINRAKEAHSALASINASVQSDRKSFDQAVKDRQSGKITEKEFQRIAKQDQMQYQQRSRELDAIQNKGFFETMFGGSGFATGGFTGRGNKYDIAGVVHRGEYVVPKESVDQQTGLPKGGGHTVVIQNMNVNNGGDEQRLLRDIGFALEAYS